MEYLIRQGGFIVGGCAKAKAKAQANVQVVGLPLVLVDV